MDSSLSQILSAGESESVEFKGNRAPLDALAKAVCGMLNQQGGMVLWGVDEKGRPLGMDEAADRVKKLNDFLMSHLTPRPLISVSVCEVGKTQIVMIDIPPGSDKPYSINREIWVRVGSQTLKADQDRSTRLVEESATHLDRWEREPMPGFELADCDSDELALARRDILNSGRFGVEIPESHEDLLRRLYLTKSGQLTNAAVVLFAGKPRVWVPNLAVRIISYSKGKTGDLDNDVTVEGPAIRVLKEAIGILQQRTGFSGRFDKGKLEREDRPAYALYALREGLVNAMVHRDYEAIGGNLRVEIFPDYLVIQNPGKLPDGWVPRDLQTKHESHPGNPDIARVFYLRLLMDQLGAGTQRLIEVCRELKAKQPVWRAENGVVTLTLFRAPEPKADTYLLGRQMNFLKTIKAGQEFKLTDYASATKISERQARRDLSEMVFSGVLEQVGKGPATSYRRTERRAR